MVWQKKKENQRELINNYAVQSQVTSRIFPIMRNVMQTGNLSDKREKNAQQSAKLGLIALIKYVARQSEADEGKDGKIFTLQESEKFWKMDLPELFSELSYFQEKSGLMLMSKPPMINFLAKTISYHEAIRANPQRSRIKLVIIPATAGKEDDGMKEFPTEEEVL